MQRSAILLALATVASPIWAADLSECASVENDLDRLACYDGLSGRTPEVESEPAEGDWHSRTETSKLTDQRNVYLSVESQDMTYCSWSQAGAPVTLIIRCREDTTALILVTECHMASGLGGYGQVEYRTDGDKTRTVHMEASTNNRSLGLWRGARSIPMVKNLFGKQQMVARFTPYGENPQTVTFNVAGLEEAIEPLRESCHW